MRLKRAAERQVRKRHPWVFESSVKTQNRTGDAGELAVIYDRQDQFLAIGLYDPHSSIRIRILHAGQPVRIDHCWWEQKLLRSIRLRHEVLQPDTTGLRWIYGENDGWPGLVLDGYGKTLVVKLYTTAWFAYLKELQTLFQRHLQCDRIVLRLSRNIQSLPTPDPAWTDGATLLGQAPQGAVIFEESGIRMCADVLRGQKTGFFLDQRNNRCRVGLIAHGKSILNLFSFSGGFALHAARGGAASVTNVDISPHALDECQSNWNLNAGLPGFRQCHLRNIQADVFAWLEHHANTYDIVIIDPPSLARRQADRDGALKAYHNLARAGQRLTRPDGILLCCSCSAHVSREDFIDVIQKATRLPFRIHQVTGHAVDHPCNVPELNYLKAVYLSAHPHWK
ncbi:MAG: class I SAM-dependent methyltransferase [Verrucomicrobiota bacterium]